MRRTQAHLLQSRQRSSRSLSSVPLTVRSASAPPCARQAAPARPGTCSRRRLCPRGARQPRCRAAAGHAVARTAPSPRRRTRRCRHCPAVRHRGRPARPPPRAAATSQSGQLEARPATPRQPGTGPGRKRRRRKRPSAACAGRSSASRRRMAAGRLMRPTVLRLLGQRGRRRRQRAGPAFAGTPWSKTGTVVFPRKVVLLAGLDKGLFENSRRCSAASHRARTAEVWAREGKGGRAAVDTVCTTARGRERKTIYSCSGYFRP